MSRETDTKNKTTVEFWQEQPPTRKFAVLLVLMTLLLVLSCLVVLSMGDWKALEANYRRYLGGTFAPISPETAPILRQKPRLQVDEHYDMDAYRAQQNKLLNSYEWIDPGKGTVRIPVERAMEILVEKGLPARAQREER